MMSILCTQYDIELKSLDESTSRWYEDYTLIFTSTRFLKKEQDLKTTIERYTLNIICTKENKFLRDLSAHTNGFAYKWTQNTNSRNKPSKYDFESNTKNKNDNNTNMSSSSSSLSSNQSTVYRDLWGDRLPKRCKGNSDAASTESLTHHLGNSSARRSQPAHTQQAPAQPIPVTQPTHHPWATSLNITFYGSYSIIHIQNSFYLTPQSY